MSDVGIFYRNIISFFQPHHLHFVIVTFLLLVAIDTATQPSGFYGSREHRGCEI